MPAQFDLPIDQLRTFRPELPRPDDFDAFWADTLAAAGATDLDPQYRPADTPLALVDVVDVSYRGAGGVRIGAWLTLPRGTTAPMPTVVEFVGYTGGRGHPHEHLVWANLGYAHLVVDTRGQGSSINSTGVTPDEPGEVGPHFPGFLTMGIESPQRYYYRRVFVDAVRALEVVAEHPLLDRDRVVVTGGSQGGGIAIAVAGLVPDLRGVMPDVPFLCHIRRATEVTDARPYLEISAFLAGRRDAVEPAFATLAYFDGVHLGALADAPALFSVALMDPICPPSTVFAAYNHWGSRAGAGAVDKQIEIYPYNGHEGGGAHHRRAQFRFVADRLGPPTPGSSEPGPSSPPAEAHP